MKTNKKLFKYIIGTLALTTLFVLPTSLILTSCSKNNFDQINYDKNVSELVNSYRNELNTYIKGDSDYYIYNDDKVPGLLKICDDNLLKANQIKNNNWNSLSIDGQIWLDSLIDEISIKKQMIESNIHYLLIDKYDNLIFTNYHSTLSNQIKNAIDTFLKYKADGSFDLDATISSANDFNNFLNIVIENLTTGMEKGITLSGVIIKHAIGNLFQTCFVNILNYYAQNSTQEISYDTLVNNNLLPFSCQLDKASGLSDAELSTLKELANNLDQNLITNFLNFICNKFYASINYGRSDIGNYQLKIMSTNPNEEDNGYIYKNNDEIKYISGLGLNNDDLNTKDIGIGFMKSHEENNDVATGYGEIIYNALIRKHSNTTQTAQQIFNLGNSAVADIKENMKAVARKIASIYVGENTAWSAENVYYDPDSSNNEYGAQKITIENIVDAEGNVDLAKFFQWLNTNQWFNGRDMTDEQFPTLNGVNPIYSAYTKNDGVNPNQNIWNSKTIPYTYESTFIADHKNITNVEIGNVIGNWQDFVNNNIVNSNSQNQPTIVDGDAGNLAYKYLVEGLSPATIQSSNNITDATQNNSISPEAAYIGASKAIEQYLKYKDASVDNFNAMFKNTSVDYTLRTGIGGAAYANAGDGSWEYSDKGYGGFFLDTNPYFGLQKWSMTTLATHEGVCGHVFQFNYAHDHPAVDYAPEFSSTAYAEGWGLFSEWLAVQLGMYGEPTIITNENSNQLALPNFGVNSQNINVEQYTEKYEFANGVYWVDKDNPNTTTVESGYNSQALFDATQYFGFLNERQLRTMRCAVDVGIHAGGGNINEDGTISNLNNAGQFIEGTGWSLQESRKYLSTNSGLGIDDINRETKRYLEYTGQAVSYYNGTVAIQNLYVDAVSKYYSNFNSNFMDYLKPESTNDNTSGLFDIILRNGDIPLEVLTNAVDQFINNNYNK